MQVKTGTHDIKFGRQTLVSCGEQEYWDEFKGDGTEALMKFISERFLESKLFEIIEEGDHDSGISARINELLIHGPVLFESQQTRCYMVPIGNFFAYKVVRFGYQTSLWVPACDLEEVTQILKQM